MLDSVFEKYKKGLAPDTIRTYVPFAWREGEAWLSIFTYLPTGSAAYYTVLQLC